MAGRGLGRHGPGYDVGSWRYNEGRHGSMSSFTSPLFVEEIGGGNWRIAQEFDYAVGTEDSGIVIGVPAGFVTDFASIPQVLWNILPPVGKYGKAAVIHDYLYCSGGRVITVPQAGRALKLYYSREQCDDIFREAMEVLGVGRIKRNLMWLAVRAFGGPSFKAA